MQLRSALFGTVTIAVLVAAGPVCAETLKSSIAFNTGIGEQTANQPTDGVEVAYQVDLKGGELDGCTVDVIEILVPREEGAWGFFDITGDVRCDRGGFSYSSSGAWDGNGFHAAGVIKEDSGTDAFKGISGRVAQLNGSGTAAADNTTDIAYDLVFDTTEN